MKKAVEVRMVSDGSCVGVLRVCGEVDLWVCYEMWNNISEEMGSR